MKSGYLAPFDTGGYYETYVALRSGALHAFPAVKWHGIVTFPSFHVIYSLTGLYAVAHIRPLAIVSALVSAAVAVSAVPVGGHYAIDIVCGAAVWCAAVVFVERRRARLDAVTGTQKANMQPVFAGIAAWLQTARGRVQGWSLQKL